MPSVFHHLYWKVNCKSYYCFFETNMHHPPDPVAVHFLFVFDFQQFFYDVSQYVLCVFIMLQVRRAFEPVNCYHLSVLENSQLVSLQILLLLIISFLSFRAFTRMHNNLFIIFRISVMLVLCFLFVCASIYIFVHVMFQYVYFLLTNAQI